MNKIGIVLFMLAVGVFADATYTKNKKANKLYEQGEYQKALELYEEAHIESPEEKNLSYNKGSAHYKMGQLDKALQEYQNASGIKDGNSRADL
ncbi:MAG: tetratricopeptide repeat protein, partial [Chitinispirillaceae bacterium]